MRHRAAEVVELFGGESIRDRCEQAVVLLFEVVEFACLQVEWRPDQHLLVELVVDTVPLIRKLSHTRPVNNKLLVNLLFRLVDHAAAMTCRFILIFVLSVLNVNVFNPNAASLVRPLLLVTHGPNRRVAAHG